MESFIFAAVQNSLRHQHSQHDSGNLPRRVMKLHLLCKVGSSEWNLIFTPGLLSYLYRAIMLKTGILNPQLLSLLARVRHTNSIVIADRGFPFWPQIETVDISLVENIPTVLGVLRAIRPNFTVGKAWMAQEFLGHNNAGTRRKFVAALKGTSLKFEPHIEFKKRVPQAIGLIRTGDAMPYANMILESA